MNQITGAVFPPVSPVPKRPTLYALATFNGKEWTLSYGGQPREWIEKSQQPLHAGSMLVVVPGEDAQPAVTPEQRDGDQFQLVTRDRIKYLLACEREADALREIDRCSRLAWDNNLLMWDANVQERDYPGLPVEWEIAEKAADEARAARDAARSKA